MLWIKLLHMSAEYKRVVSVFFLFCGNAGIICCAHVFFLFAFVVVVVFRTNFFYENVIKLSDSGMHSTLEVGSAGFSIPPSEVG